MNGILSALQILLIQGVTFGLSPFLFALGDDAFAEFIAGIQFLPTTIMMVHLCPAGSEGASYAMFTTVNNSALNLAGSLSTIVLGFFDVSKDALFVASDVCEDCEGTSAVGEAYNCTVGFLDEGSRQGADDEAMCGTHEGGISNMTKLTVLTTVLQMSGILFVGLLPKTREDLMNLNYGNSSRVGGFIFLFVTGASILNSVIVGLLNVFDPTWAGAGR
jgi:hypothetical protein